MLLITQGIIAYVIFWCCWRILRRLTVKTDLNNVPGPASDSFLTGNFSQIVGINAWSFHKELAQKYGGAVVINGFLGEKRLYVSDPLALYHIIVKDQEIFEASDIALLVNVLLFGPSLLATIGNHHRKQRKILNPIFSIAHMRQMVPIFYDVAHKLGTGLESTIKNGSNEIDLLEWFTRTALELIAQSGLGYSLDPLTSESDVHPYNDAVKQIFPLIGSMLPAVFYLPVLVKFGPPRFRRFIVDHLPFKNTQQLRDVIDVMHGTSVEILKSKEHALQEGDEAMVRQIGMGRDIISLLMKANMQASDEDKVPQSEILAHMTTFITAAMDTTSNALSRIVHLLATYPEVQDKLRQEIMDALCNNHGQDFSYDDLGSLSFLDAVCRETLRLFPPITTIHRLTRQDTVLPLSNPITGIDGHEMREILVPRNTNVAVSILNCNRNPALWGPDAHEWKPERWLAPVPDTLARAPIPGVYSHLMSFSGGSRACIGFKFSELEIKVVLSLLLSKFQFALSDEIVWVMNAITAPTIKGKSDSPALPLKVMPLRTACSA